MFKKDSNVNEEITDTFILASFPKSGNTWVRFLIANIYNNLRKEFDEIDFFNVHEIVPESNLNIKPYYNDFPNVFKTHNHYKELYQNVILILRNPWDVIYSYYQYVRGEQKISISLPEVIKHKKYGIRAIVNHTNSFIKNCDNILALTYEKLLNNPENESRKICDFLKITVSDDIIQDAVKRSSFISMRKIELKKGRKFGSSEFLFTRSGRIGEGEQEIRKYNELHKFVLEELKKCPVMYLLYS